MSRHKATTLDGDLQQVFGNPVAELYEAAAGRDASPALARALELRSFLALTEEQVALVRDRVHADMDPDRDMDELSADTLRFDAPVAGSSTGGPRRLPRSPRRAAAHHAPACKANPARSRGTAQGHRHPASVCRPGTSACRGGPGPPTVKALDCPTSRLPT
ncbi:hypothetical protein GTY87_35205 [Streptomyces sp. SID7813]|uniref:Uncharacterized protein n=1 Tax=Streptomyces coelicolor (strain ATCC BAA-471 / A3(2) / M145) TaxID=100226 RepID=Q9L1M3_STRCO|nr:hypothetical protein [Streptomyces sp. SID7813]QFI46670.1 hypothetical protein FQ762_35550 [Streptomyces coelicolor A3(2)]CAB72397.1 hypothetical protein SC7F9.44 [Streptomyces coelicolor A3(2)]